MQIILTARGLYFCGKTRDLRRFLRGLAGPPRRLLADYLRERLK